ncbi:unnamed protein product, partial [Mesorhabditis spiculigera]
MGEWAALHLRIIIPSNHSHSIRLLLMVRGSLLLLPMLGLSLLSVVISAQDAATTEWPLIPYACNLAKKVDNVDQDCTPNPPKSATDGRTTWFTIRDLRNDRLVIYRCSQSETFCLSMTKKALPDDKIGCYGSIFSEVGCNCDQDLGSFTFTPAHPSVLALWKEKQKPGEPPGCGTYEVPDDPPTPSSSSSSWPSSALLLVVTISLVARLIYP